MLKQVKGVGEMARLLLTIRGELGRLSLNSFLGVLDNSLYVLRDLDKRISEERSGTMQWFITRVWEGNSVELELEPRVLRGQIDRRRPVLVGFTDGVEQIVKEGTTPRYFDWDDLVHVRNIVRQFGRDGLEGVVYSVEEYDKRTNLTREAGSNVESLLGEYSHALGSIEGRIELISIHTRYKHFNIYQDVTQKAIRCNLPEEYESDVFKAAEGRRRVISTGLISYNRKGEPIRILLKKPLRFLKEEESLPSIKDMLGSAPDITGDLCTEDYIRSMRE